MVHALEMDETFSRPARYDDTIACLHVVFISIQPVGQEAFNRLILFLLRYRIFQWRDLQICQEHEWVFRPKLILIRSFLLLVIQVTYTTFTGPYVGKPNAFQVVVAGEYTRHKDFHSV